jgi:hypothetical protein
MAEFKTLKLKVGNHYQNLLLGELYKQWKTDELQTYNFSKAQLTRIKKQFEECKDQLTPPNPIPCLVPKDTVNIPHDENIPPFFSCPPEKDNEFPFPISDENLDVYTDDDFTHPEAIIMETSTTYYEELLHTVNVLHQQLNTHVTYS